MGTEWALRGTAPGDRFPSDGAGETAEIRYLWLRLDELARNDGKRGRLTRPLALALRLILPTGQRPGEVANARWKDVKLDAEAPLWVIPETKTDRPHRVPLSAQAVEVFRELRLLTANSDFVLPSPRTDEPRPDDAKILARVVRGLYAEKRRSTNLHTARSATH